MAVPCEHRTLERRGNQKVCTSCRGAIYQLGPVGSGGAAGRQGVLIPGPWTGGVREGAAGGGGVLPTMPPGAGTGARRLVVDARFVAPVPLVTGAFHCVCLAYRTETGEAFRLGSRMPASAWGAVLWLSWRAAHIADQLDPHVARPVRAWLEDRSEQGRALDRLVRGRPYVLLIWDGSLHYVLSVAPRSDGGGVECSAAGG
ncbi:hypothetical protein GCM10009716_17820 [Streptomyces sodiiphilus]|uniref:Uncharacterized protein n=1 Tax=Streptomyces sodiiphilus TaxID=226217 RepID=A0ABN2P0L2_9ACTN